MSVQEVPEKTVGGGRKDQAPFPRRLWEGEISDQVTRAKRDRWELTVPPSLLSR